jgi:hypothetical protein
MNCKPGDLALCIAGEFAGAVCEVVAPSEIFLRVSTQELMFGWLVRFPRPMKWGEMCEGCPPNEGWYPDAHLRPLRPDADEAPRVAEIPMEPAHV